MKRLLAILLAVLMMLSCTAMASEVKEIKDAAVDGLVIDDLLKGLPVPELPLVDEPTTLTVMFPRNTNHGDFNNMWFLKEVEAQTGIKLEIQAIESTGFEEKQKLAFASGDYSDIFLVGMDLTEASTYGAAGMLLPLEDLIAEHAPNIQKIFEIMPEIFNSITSEDGHIYILPAIDTPARDSIPKTGFINAKWLENLGIAQPTTVEELYDCFVAIRDNDANGNGDATDEIPLSFVYDSVGCNAGTVLLFPFGYVNMLHDVIDGEYVYVPMQDNFREYLKYMNLLWEENLLDHEVFTQTAAQYNAKLAEYTTFMASPEMKDVLPDTEQHLAYELVGPLTSSVNSVPTWGAQNYEKVSSGSFAITDNCTEEMAIAAIKLCDYFYSEDVSFMIKCGPEKGSWEGEGGWTRITAEDGAVSYEIDYSCGGKYNSFWDFRCANGLMNMPFLYTSTHSALVLGANPWANHLSWDAFESGAVAARRYGYPNGVSFTEDEQDTLAMYVLLDSYVDQNVAKFITGEIDIEDDAEWAKYIEGIKAMDVDTLIETRQTAYDRWAARGN